MIRLDAPEYSRSAFYFRSSFYSVREYFFSSYSVFVREIFLVLVSDVVLESGNVLESDSSPYFEDSDSDLNPGLGLGLTQHCKMTWNNGAILFVLHLLFNGHVLFNFITFRN